MSYTDKELLRASQIAYYTVNEDVIFEMNDIDSDDYSLKSLYTNSKTFRESIYDQIRTIAGFDDSFDCYYENRENALLAISDPVARDRAEEVYELIEEMINEGEIANWKIVSYVDNNLNTNGGGAAILSDNSWENITLDMTGNGFGALAQSVVSIVPEDAELIVEAQVLNQDIGYISVGQEVSVKLDTFSFQKYGTLKGKITYISPSAVEDETKGQIYIIKASIDERLKSIDGKEAILSSGMSGTAEIKLENRKIIEFFLEPIFEYFDNSLKLR